MQNEKKHLSVIIRNYYLKSNDLWWRISFKFFDDEYIKAKYQDVFWGSTFEAVNLLQKADLNKKIENYKKLKVYIKMD